MNQKVRRIIYTVAIVSQLFTGCALAYCSAVGVVLPWLTGLASAVSFLCASTGVVSITHINQPPRAEDILKAIKDLEKGE